MAKEKNVKVIDMNDTNQVDALLEKVSHKVRIKKAKIKDDLFLEGEYSEELPGHSKKDSKFSCTVPIHEDLKAAIEKLHVHLAILCDYENTKKAASLDDLAFPAFQAKGFSIGGNEENEGVTISGNMDGKYGLVNLNTPFKKLEDTEYPHIGHLGACIQSAIYEVEQYLFEGKRAPEKQLSMFDEEDPQTPEEEN